MRSIPPIHRETARIVLRPLQADDGPEYSRVVRASEEAWARWTPAVQQGLTLEERFRRELDRTVLGARMGTHLRLAAFLPTGELVGHFALNEIVRGVFESAYASWQVAAPRVGDGLGTEGVRGLLDIAFSHGSSGLALHRVQANIMSTNRASLRIAEKVGFRQEGLALRYLKIAGAWEDHLMHAITSEEWTDRHAMTSEECTGRS